VNDDPAGQCPADIDEGCLPRMQDLVKSKLRIIEYTALAIGGIEIIALLFSCCLCMGVRSHHSREEDNERLLSDAHSLNRQYH